MDDKLSTTDSIIQWFKSSVENRDSIAPAYWLEAGLRLNLLREDDDVKLIDSKQVVAQKRIKLLEEGMNATQAKMHVEGSDEYKTMLAQSAKVVRIEEFIRLSKLYSRLKNEEMRHS